MLRSVSLPPPLRAAGNGHSGEEQTAHAVQRTAVIGTLGIAAEVEVGQRAHLVQCFGTLAEHVPVASEARQHLVGVATEPSLFISSSGDSLRIWSISVRTLSSSSSLPPFLRQGGFHVVEGGTLKQVFLGNGGEIVIELLVQLGGERRVHVAL